MPYKNIEDRRAASRRHYERNAQAMKDRAMAFKIKQRKDLQLYIRELKEKDPCLDCGVSYPHYVMQFDHVRGEKLFNIGDFATGPLHTTKKKLLEEIAKCEIVCGNCHAARTWTRRQKTPSEEGVFQDSSADQI